VPRSAIVVSSAVRSSDTDEGPLNLTDKTLSGRVPLDSRTFERCRFKNAVLVYSGGPPPSIVNCSFEEVGFEFQGAAGRTLALLQALSAPRSGFREIFKATFPKMFGH
jgi:hypothetical protein